MSVIQVGWESRAQSSAESRLSVLTLLDALATRQRRQGSAVCMRGRPDAAHKQKWFQIRAAVSTTEPDPESQQAQDPARAAKRPQTQRRGAATRLKPSPQQTAKTRPTRPTVRTAGRSRGEPRRARSHKAPKQGKQEQAGTPGGPTIKLSAQTSASPRHTMQQGCPTLHGKQI
jgi:hypothetical protein